MPNNASANVCHGWRAALMLSALAAQLSTTTPQEVSVTGTVASPSQQPPPPPSSSSSEAEEGIDIEMVSVVVGNGKALPLVAVYTETTPSSVSRLTLPFDHGVEQVEWTARAPRDRRCGRSARFLDPNPVQDQTGDDNCGAVGRGMAAVAEEIRRGDGGVGGGCGVGNGRAGGADAVSGCGGCGGGAGDAGDGAECRCHGSDGSGGSGRIGGKWGPGQWPHGGGSGDSGPIPVALPEKPFVSNSSDRVDAVYGGGANCEVADPRWTNLALRQDQDGWEVGTGLHDDQSGDMDGWQQEGRRKQKETADGAAQQCSPQTPKVGPTHEALTTYIVQWADFYPIDEHPQLLTRALGSCCHYCCSSVGGAGVDVGGRSAGIGVGVGVVADGGSSNIQDDESDDGIGSSSSRSSNRDSNININSTRNNNSNSNCNSSSNSNSNNDDTSASKNDKTGEGDPSFCDCCWEIVERKNVATNGKFPSDFAVVKWVPSRRDKTTLSADTDSTSEERRKPLHGVPEAKREVGARDGGCESQGEHHQCAEAECRGHGGHGNAGRVGASLEEAAARRAVAALRSSPWVESVHREKMLTRGTSSAVPESAFDPDFDEEGPGPIGFNSDGGFVADEHAHSESSNTATPKAHLQPQMDSQWQSSGGRGRRRNLDGGSAGAGGGGRGGGGLRGSSRGGDFVDSGRQGKHLHDQGFTGAGVRIAVFDTGLAVGGHDFGNVVEQINWTDEDTLEDNVGHGTHIAGVIGGRDPGCSGFAPDADMFVFRVFSSEQVSYTSWFLDAFNYALFLGVDIINLSVGGPDFLDSPFVDKIHEMSANGIVVVSAVGNDGPLYGTQHNPADQMDTIGVGAVSTSGRGVANFQSRGMTTWELPGGYGRVKPDLIAVGQHVLGPTAGGDFGQCSGLSGTSVASPVVAGAVALLASTVPRNRRRDIVNPASIKQVLTESAHRVREAGVFEQGAGSLDVLGAFRLLSRYTPRASFLPPQLDFTDPYMWPFSRQPLYFGAQPVMFNVTVVNGMGVTGRITSVTWVEEEPRAGGGENGHVLSVEADFSDILWPWSGYLAVSLSVSEYGRDFRGLVLGTLEVTVESEAGPGEKHPRKTNAALPISVNVARTPPRHRRLLWDQFHSVPYPPHYAPRDYLGNDPDMLDRLGDHPHTNFRSLFETLLGMGYYVEVLGSDWSSFDADQYGALLVVDPEAELGPEEKAKLELDVRKRGLSLVVFADWYSENMMSQVKFVDDNTRMPWTPITGGSNVPAINSFLLPAFGMSLGLTAFDGVFSLPGGEVHLASGNAVSRMPVGGLAVSVSLTRAGMHSSGNSDESPAVTIQSELPVIGAFDINRSPSKHSGRKTGGRVFLFGDSSCADDDALSRLQSSRGGGRGGGADCLWLFKAAVRYACEGFEDPGVFRNAKAIE